MLYRPFRAAFFVAARHFSAAAPSAAAAESHATTSSSAAVDVKGGGGDRSLGWRLLGLVYPKLSAVVTIRQWIEEGHTVQKYQLNRIVRDLRRHKRYKHALEVCEWMTLQEEIKLLPGDYAIHLDLIAKVRGLKSAEKFFEDLPDKMRSQPTCTALLHSYVQKKMSTKAEALMKKMAECGFLKTAVTYNQMINLYVSNGQFEKAQEMIQVLKRNTTPDVVTYNLWLTACAGQNDVEAAERVFLEIKKANLDPDWVSFSVLTNLYMKKELPEKAASTLKEMEKRVSKRNRASYSSLLSLYANMGNKDGVNNIWENMKCCFNKLHDHEYTCMMSSLVKFNDIEAAETLYTEWESVSRTGNFRIPNVLLAAYINRKQIEMAERLHKRMEKKGIQTSYTTWELLTCGYLKEEQSERVLDCFKKAINCVQKWDPNKKLVRDMFKHFEERGNIKGAEELLVILRRVRYLNTDMYNSLLRTYARAGKMPLVVLEQMKKDNIKLDEETEELIKVTGKMRTSDVDRIPSAVQGLDLTQGPKKTTIWRVYTGTKKL